MISTLLLFLHPCHSQIWCLKVVVILIKKNQRRLSWELLFANKTKTSEQTSVRFEYKTFPQTLKQSKCNEIIQILHHEQHNLQSLSEAASRRSFLQPNVHAPHNLETRFSDILQFNAFYVLFYLNKNYRQLRLSFRNTHFWVVFELNFPSISFIVLLRRHWVYNFHRSLLIHLEKDK